MSRNSLYAILAVLAVAVVGLGAYMVYQDSQRPGLEIRVDEGGISVDGN